MKHRTQSIKNADQQLAYMWLVPFLPLLSIFPTLVLPSCTWILPYPSLVSSHPCFFPHIAPSFPKSILKFPKATYVAWTLCGITDMVS